VQHIKDIKSLREATTVWREAGKTVALVPTMGNLHRGHLRLVEIAAEHADHVIVSVFVNPTQFGPMDDFDRYPRTLDVDARRLSNAGVDVLFAPEVDAMYPRGLDNATLVVVPELAEQLCGASRPGHFTGVTSVVSRLLNICQPSSAVFGQKDYQQFIILKRMVGDLHQDVRLLLGETYREDSGLAKSSRNSFLTDVQKDQAAAIYAALTRAAEILAKGEQQPEAIEKLAAGQIEAAGLRTEYVAVRSADHLGVPEPHEQNLIVLAAARLGAVRLIDNVLVTRGAKVD
jgi:pantoate--beta-alanine ligase